MQDSISVLIVDDQALCREGLRALMGYWSEFEVVGEAASGAEAIAFCREHAPDLVLMDVQMPGMSGCEATATICKENPLVIVVMLTVAADDESLFTALEGGARGYVLKDMPSRQLREQLNGVIRGEAALSGSIATKIIRELNSRHSPKRAIGASQRAATRSLLTEREVDILRLVAQGLSNEEIGARLYLGAGTVKKQLSQIMQKLDLENRVQVAVYAIRAGLAD